MRRYITIILPVFFSSCGSPSKQTEETINTALSYDYISSGNSSDTIYERIYGDFAPNIIPIKVKNKYGLYDTSEHKAITEIKYDNIGSFAHEGTVDFTVNKKYGYLNFEGREIVEPKYDFTFGFSNGLASVKLNEKYGYINMQGNVVIPIEYDMAWDFNRGIGAVKKDGKWGFINTKGKYVLDPIYDDVTRDFDDTIGVANVSIANQHFFINRKGKRIRDSKPFEKFVTK